METIIVTGATGNLGQAVVRQLHQQGFRVAFTVTPGGDTAAYSEYGAVGYPVDLLDEAGVGQFMDQVIAEHGPVRAAVLLVGGFAAGDLRSSSSASMEKMFQLNFLTAYHLTRPLLKHFDGLPGRRQVIFIGSRPAYKPSEGKKFFAYALSKSLLLRMADIINAEAPHGAISASVVIPSTMDTPANRAAMPNADFTDWVPTERVAEAAGFLLTEAGAMLRETVLKVYNNS